MKTWLYRFLSFLLLFTVAIVTNIESEQQTINVTLDNAYLHVFVPVKALICIRSEDSAAYACHSPIPSQISCEK